MISSWLSSFEHVNPALLGLLKDASWLALSAVEASLRSIVAGPVRVVSDRFEEMFVTAWAVVRSTLPTS